MSKVNYAEMEKKYVYGTWTSQSKWSPRVIVSGEGCYVTDIDGNRILDFSSQLMCSNIGHGNRAVIDAMTEQAKQLCFASPSFATMPAALLGKKLAEIAPGDLCKSYLTIGGAEANEAAIKIARMYTKKSKLISRYRSYHGASSGAIALTGDPRSQQAVGMPGVVRAPDCYCYRCPFGKTYPGCGITCVEYIDEIIKLEGPHTVAGVVVEPIVGSNGILVPPDEYMPRLREICDENEALLIDDEVMTGFGRTGKMFCVEHWGVSPDIMSMAKGISGAYLPVGATMTSRKIAEYFDQPENNFSHGQTYANHPMCCAVSLATIEEYEKKKIVQNAAKMGKVMEKKLKELAEEHRSIGEVRGKGLFWGVELVRNRETKEPFVARHLKADPNIIQRVSSEAMKRGVYISNFINTLIVAPPLIAKEKEIEEGVVALGEALKAADKETS